WFAVFACAPAAADGIVDTQCGAAFAVPSKGRDAGKEIRVVFTDYAAVYFMDAAPVMTKDHRDWTVIIIPPRNAFSKAPFATGVKRRGGFAFDPRCEYFDGILVLFNDIQACMGF